MQKKKLRSLWDVIKRKRETSLVANERFTAAFFLAPLFLVLAAFIVFPILGTLGSSLFRDVAFIPKKFIGFGNYLDLFRDTGFWQALRFTLGFIAVSVPLEILLGLVFALVLNESFPFRGLLRIAVLIPWAVPSSVSARIWQLIYNYQYGLANFILAHLRLPAGPVDWLGTNAGAFLAVVAADAWKTAPFVALILLAGLQAISEDIYEQAKADGADIFQRLFYITLPLLKPALIVSLLFRTIDALRIFDLIYVLTGGGPGGSTNSVSLYAYKYFLLSDFGYGAAISTVLFLAALLLSFFYLKYGRFKETLT